MEMKWNSQVDFGMPSIAAGLQSASLSTMLSNPKPCTVNSDCSNGLTCVDLSGPQLLNLNETLTGKDSDMLGTRAADCFAAVVYWVNVTMCA